ncbi:dihydrofolate reductase [Pseudobacteriovorax antillogorgiicola]|uniref:Dihydrofolate reductase n=1 Tax=Pseudobacteriovorax antillogorgiicola TaxID=1513793 RepID=A0A1Y6BMT9_9BACT|nr:dihydrofolate reductase [Pseudobacteriovorax antillogorgiicola]TCS55488.1 dihydrofolate reductase [Pseudobacteriovorax antillogorgiicola]SMF11833.1 dihydrofolate reductase [Pseudobacteriovorax antillogorgiicola]
MKINHIVACAENGTIGRDGSLPWHLPEDLKFFKAVTTGHVIIMGRKTFESIGKPLPQRFNIVVTRQDDFAAEGVQRACSLEEAFAQCGDLADQWGEEIYVVGGGEIYRQSMELVQKIFMTRIHKEVDGDVSYPLEALQDFELVSEEYHTDPEKFSFLTYKRKSE